jgi:hypothetical protein
MTSNNSQNDNNVIQMNLMSWCRWKALYYKGNKSLSASLQEESVYLKTLPTYMRKWIVDNQGTVLATIDSDVVKAALQLMIDDIGEVKTIKLIMTSCDDFKFYADYCYNLEQKTK